ncbi:unnamed protein product [Cylindrotheca closterium]|uniref:Kinesin light chain n=1 Tax=Cylindrotheca closterium TaxID=2856 RepID=A0AAD2FH72_9STRA|nr:unnamed protein product [Cylindrotheca closterium]
MQEARPFFLLDWLDDLMVNQDAFQIAELLKTPSKLPQRQHLQSHHQLGSYSSHHQMISMMETDDFNSSERDQQQIMLRSISSPAVSSHLSSSAEAAAVAIPGTPTANTFRKSCIDNTHMNGDSHGILPTRLFHQHNTAAATAMGQKLETTIQLSQLTSSKSSNSLLPNNKVKSKPTAPPGIFKKRSMALGNGWNAKGLTKAKQGRWEAALACWDNALEIRLQISDASCRKDQLEVANTWNNRGIALGKLGQYHNAIQALGEAYQIRKTLLDQGHPQVVSTLHNIANVHQQQGDLTTALQVFGTAKSLLVQSLVASSPTNGNTNTDPMLLARICTAIGHIYYQAQQWIDSRDAYQDALNVLLKFDSSSSASTDQQREIYELQRDIQELNGKIPITFANHGMGSMATMGGGGGVGSSFYHGHHGHCTSTQQSPQPQQH